jgi:hypothetical protein
MFALSETRLAKQLIRNSWSTRWIASRSFPQMCLMWWRSAVTAATKRLALTTIHLNLIRLKRRLSTKTLRTYGRRIPFSLIDGSEKVLPRAINSISLESKAKSLWPHNARALMTSNLKNICSIKQTDWKLHGSRPITHWTVKENTEEL